MKLHKDPLSIASKHTGVNTKRQAEIINFLRAQREDDLPRIVEQFRKNEMPAAELSLVEELLGIKAPEKTAPKKTAAKK